MLNVTYAESHMYTLHAECRYTECRYAECRGALFHGNYLTLPYKRSSLSQELSMPKLTKLILPVACTIKVL
jgi:hypothetical protein